MKEPNIISWDTFVIMQSQLLASSKCEGSDRHADAYYETLDILKMSGVTHIGIKNIEDFK